MSLAVVKSRAISGMNTFPVQVETHLSNGLPNFTIVGLLETEVRESRDRVRAAIMNAGFEFPNRRITVNLAPADLPKASGRFDLPIAIGILLASGQLRCSNVDHYEFAGELSLSGALRPIHGALAMAFGIFQEKNQQNSKLILPIDSALQARLLDTIDVAGADHLLEVCHYLTTGQIKPLPPITLSHEENNPFSVDMQDVKGQFEAKRALEIAACGGHNILLIGPPGTGKSMLASRLPTILPMMSMNESLEAAAVQSLVKPIDLKKFRNRPFRSPHHTASSAALIGGGSNPRPGEISLAHHGVLFLDELAEFDRKALESMREPLETGFIHISRAARQATFPAKFQLIAAMNPCPCANLGHPNKSCRCSPDAILRYQGKISDALLDRIAIQIQVPPVPSHFFDETTPKGEDSQTIRRRISLAVDKQMSRQGMRNHALGVQQLDQFCSLDAPSKTFLHNTLTKLGWSTRVHHHLLRLARTIADLDNIDQITMTHLAESVQLRRGLFSTS